MGWVDRAMVGAALIGLSVIPRPGHAQEFEPRSYVVAPPGLNFVAVVYGFASGAVFMDPALPAENVNADVHLVVMRYVRTLELFRSAVQAQAGPAVVRRSLGGLSRG